MSTKNTQKPSLQMIQYQPSRRVHASLTDLPPDILLDILARLSVKSAFVCRSLCKYMLSFLLSSDFAALHFSRASTGLLLIEKPERGHAAGTALHLLEFDKDRRCSLFFNAAPGTGQCASWQKYRDRVNVELDTRFVLPCLRPASTGRISVVNSCNGLLCLWSSLSRSYEYVRVKRAMKNDVIAVYNPVTGEYSLVPPPAVDKFAVKRWIHVLGLGFCRDTCQYKVLIRMKNLAQDPVHLIFTIGSGSGSWVRVENNHKENVIHHELDWYDYTQREILGDPEEESAARKQYGIERYCVYKDKEFTCQAPDVLISCDGNGGIRCFKTRGLGSSIGSAVLHVPSFLSLKDMLGDSVEVLSVGSGLTSSTRGKGRIAGPGFFLWKSVREVWRLILNA